MSPEEHFRRLRDDDVWTSGPRPSTRPASAAARPTGRRDRGPIWVTAVVAASLAVVTLSAIHFADSGTQGPQVGARAATSTTTPSRTATPTPSPSDTRSADPTDPDVRASEFHLDDPADMARAARILACFRSHGVKIVDLVPSSDDPGIENIGYGGPKNDHESIMKGLQYQDECFTAGGPVD